MYNKGDKIYLLNDKKIYKFGSHLLKKGEYEIGMVMSRDPKLFYVVKDGEYYSFKEYEMIIFFTKREIRLMKLKNVL